MKSFTILAFGLVVLVAVSMAYPQENEEDVTDALEVGDDGNIDLGFSLLNL